MKKLMALLLVLTLTMGAALVSCNDEKETEDYQDLQTNSTEWETFPDSPTNENDVLGVGADTDDSWGPIQKN